MITRSSVLTCQKQLPDCYDMVKRYNDIIEECKKKFDGASQWPREHWISTMAKGGAENRFQYPRAIQGHSGDTAIYPELQDNVLLPKGFTEYIFHVGNASELNSMIRNGLIPRGKSLKRGRRAVFFTTVYPMDDGNGTGENSTRSDETKNRAIQEHLEATSKYLFGAV